MTEASTCRFRPDGSFTIVQLTDVHWHNGQPDELRSLRLPPTHEPTGNVLSEE